MLHTFTIIFLYGYIIISSSCRGTGWCSGVSKFKYPQKFRL